MARARRGHAQGHREVALQTSDTRRQAGSDVWRDNGPHPLGVEWGRRHRTSVKLTSGARLETAHLQLMRGVPLPQEGEAAAMVLARSRLEAPNASSDRISRSSETVGSPPSIFATRDWLERIRLAKAVWVRFCFRRRSFRLSANRSLSSTYAASSSESPRNSWTPPTRHPFFSSLCFLLRRIIVSL